MTTFRHALSTYRTQIIAYGLGLGAYAGLVALLFTYMGEAAGELEATYPREILEVFGGGTVSLATPAGFITLEFFSMAPLFFSVFAVLASTGALAGDEGSGTLEFVGALPLSRRQIFAEKALALFVGMAIIAAIICLGWVLTVPFLDFEGLTLPMLIGATFAQLSLLAFFAAVGLLLGAIAPSRGAAAAWTGGVVAFAYLAATLASAIDAVSWMKYLSAFYLADFPTILVDGIVPWHFAVLWAATIILGIAALRAFEGREIGSEQWQMEAIAGRRTAPAP